MMLPIASSSNDGRGPQHFDILCRGHDSKTLPCVPALQAWPDLSEDARLTLVNKTEYEEKAARRKALLPQSDEELHAEGPVHAGFKTMEEETAEKAEAHISTSRGSEQEVRISTCRVESKMALGSSNCGGLLLDRGCFKLEGTPIIAIIHLQCLIQCRPARHTQDSSPSIICRTPGGLEVRFNPTGQ